MELSRLICNLNKDYSVNKIDSSLENDGSYEFLTRNYPSIIEEFLADTAEIQDPQPTIKYSVLHTLNNQPISIRLKNQVKVTFKNTDNSLIEEFQQLEGELLKLPQANLSTKNKKFIGWKPKIHSRVPDQNIEYQAVFKTIN